MNTITFTLPSNDIQLSKQVYAHVEEHSEAIDTLEFLNGIPKKFKFAGYIGVIDYLFDEIVKLKTELACVQGELSKVKKSKRPWLF